jgi:hypothetical protein
MAWERIRVFANDGGTERLVVVGNDAGLFSYAVERFFGPAEEDEGEWPDGFWAPDGQAGYYQSAAEAEQSARMSIDWLRAAPISE